MNHLIVLLFLFFFHNGFAQDNDYVKDTSGVITYGKIKKGTAAAQSKQINFKIKGSKVVDYDATQLLEWGTEDKIYQSKRFPVSAGDTAAVFMELISAEDGRVKAYEFFNTFKGVGVSQTLLERDSVFTVVEFGQFKKQMKSYFIDQPEIVEQIIDSRAGKENLLMLIAEYNDLMLEPAEVIMARIEEKKKNKLSKKVWNMADMLLSQEVATQKYQKELENSTKNIGDDHERRIEINTKTAIAFFEQKQYDAALPLLIQAQKDILRYNIGKNNKQKVEVLLATIYINVQRFDLAAQNNTLALAHWKNVGIDSLSLKDAYSAYLNQGIIFKYLDVSKENINYYTPIVAEGQQWETSLKKMKHSSILHLKEPEKSIDFSLALFCFRTAQELIGKFPSEQHHAKQIEVRLELGALYFEADDYIHSKSYYESALELMKKYVKQHPKLAETTRVLGEICLAEQLYTEALAYVDQAQHLGIGSTVEIDKTLLKNISKIPFPFELLNSIVTKGIILYKKNRKSPSEVELKKVLAHYTFATELLQELRNTHRNEGSDYTLANVTHRLSQHAVIICNTLFELTKKEEYLKEAFRYAELSKSAVLYEAVHDLKSLAVSGIPKDLILKETGLKTQIAYLKGEVFYALQESAATRDEEAIKEIEQAIVQVTKEHSELMDYFEKDYPDYFALKYNYKSIELEDLQKVLAPNEVFLEYVATDSFIYVLAIDNKSVRSKFTPLKATLHHTAKQLHFALKNDQAGNYQESGRIIYAATIGGIADFIKGKKLIISPDAELHYIPFGVLPTNKEYIQGGGDAIYKDIRYLIEDHAICYNHSATLFMLSKNKKQAAASKKVATWAPKFDLMGEILKEHGIAEKLDPLPGAKKEASEIAAMFGATAYLEHDASEAKFKKLAGEYSVLHIATHGVLNDTDPLFSSLILSNEGDEDGILHAFELYNMSINADLAVLSACNSGMGKLTKAEGVVSIARAFSYAGVPNIVMSKWPVSDWSTSVLMKSFYENLHAGMPKDEALQQAKIKYLNDMRSQGKKKLLAPFFWGGFVLSGNPEPIEGLGGLNTNNMLLYGGIIGAILLILGGLFWWKRRKTVP